MAIGDEASPTWVGHGGFDCNEERKLSASGGGNELRLTDFNLAGDTPVDALLQEIPDDQIESD